MQTLKTTINPAMLKQLSNIAAPPSRVQVNPYIPQRNGAAAEDVYMKTQARHDPKSERERGLQLWEKELLESAEVKRKTTVAQICTWGLYYTAYAHILTSSLSQTSWTITVSPSSPTTFTPAHR